MKKLFLAVLAVMVSVTLFAQQFEAPQLDNMAFSKVKVHVGGDFALQFQALNQYADSALVPLGKGFNLPTANMNLGADLAPGIKVHLTVYLSSKHHNDTWVKGGYLLIDRLPIPGTESFMKYLTLKVGEMGLNYGDAHFFRTDNGNVIHNPFVGNLVMDGWTTAPAAELLFRNKGFFLMGGVTSGSLKQSLVNYSSYSGYSPQYTLKQLAYYGKIGFDKTFNKDTRLRVSLSGYHCAKNSFGTLYYGERTGTRFYLVMLPQTNSSSDVDITANPFTGRWGPGFTNKDNSVMFNVFAKYDGLQVFGTLESAKGTELYGGQDFNYSQYAFNALYYFGTDQNFYVGGRINGVNNHQNQSITRFEGTLGWFFTKNIIIKAEYVNQTYKNFTQDYGNKAGFKGLMFEAGISF